jgi:hypothetical protein
MADFQPPLRTSGRYIVDAHGKRVKLASVNWVSAQIYTRIGYTFAMPTC